AHPRQPESASGLVDHRANGLHAARVRPRFVLAGSAAPARALIVQGTQLPGRIDGGQILQTQADDRPRTQLRPEHGHGVTGGTGNYWRYSLFGRRHALALVVEWRTGAGLGATAVDTTGLRAQPRRAAFARIDGPGYGTAADCCCLS